MFTVKMNDHDAIRSALAELKSKKFKTTRYVIEDDGASEVHIGLSAEDAAKEILDYHSEHGYEIKKVDGWFTVFEATEGGDLVKTVIFGRTMTDLYEKVVSSDKDLFRSDNFYFCSVESFERDFEANYGADA